MSASGGVGPSQLARGRHLAEGFRWLGWGAAVSLLPFGLTYAFRYYNAAAFPSIDQVFGSGQGLLAALAMFAVSLKELQGPRLQRTGFADALALISLLNLATLAAGYGFISSRTLGGTPQTPAQERLVAGVTLILLGVGAATAFAATTTGSRLKEHATAGGRSSGS